MRDPSISTSRQGTQSFLKVARTTTKDEQELKLDIHRGLHYALLLRSLIHLVERVVHCKGGIVLILMVDPYLHGRSPPRKHPLPGVHQHSEQHPG